MQFKFKPTTTTMHFIGFIGTLAAAVAGDKHEEK